MFVTVSDDWSKRSTIAYITDKKKESVGKMLTGHTTIQESGLSLVRTKCAPNFSIKGSDEETVEVFTPVLTAVWPFFETMLSSGMREASENVVALDAPESTVEAMLRYLHGQDLNLHFDEAVELVMVAQMYQLPELLAIVERFFRSFDTAITQAMILWRKCCAAGNDELRGLAVSQIQMLMSNTLSFSESINELSRDEMMLLLRDLAAEASKRHI